MLFASLLLTLAAGAPPLVVGGDVYPVHAHEVRAAMDGPSFVNLEGAWCQDQRGPERKGGTWRLCLGPTSAATLAALGVRWVSTANNHADDDGPRGRAMAKRALSGRDIRAVRANTLHRISDRLWVATWHDDAPLTPLLQAMKTAPEGRLVVLAHRSRLDAAGFARALRDISDAGADVVVGAGSHRIGGVERRGEGFVFHSVGDVVMDCACSASKRGLLVHVPQAGAPWAQVIDVAHRRGDVIGALADPSAVVEVARHIAERSPRPEEAPVVVDGELRFLEVGP